MAFVTYLLTHCRGALPADDRAGTCTSSLESIDYLHLFLRAGQDAHLCASAMFSNKALCAVWDMPLRGQRGSFLTLAKVKRNRTL